MADTTYEIDYNDDRFNQIENEKQEAITDAENTYGEMINQSDKVYQDQIDASKEWADKQSAIQQEQTDHTINKIEQQKEQAEKDYTKEQAGAYTDWQKQSNQYGASAEQIAANGMAGGGYSESSKVSMYNSYQNRVATARESYNQAVLNYDNAIKDAQLANNSALADIAYKALSQQLEMAVQGMQYKNQLLMNLISQKQEINNTYYSRWQDVLAQINLEKTTQEQIRQFNEQMQFEREQAETSKKQWETQQTQQQEQWEKEYELSVKKFEEDQRQFNEQMNYKNASSTSSGKSSSGKTSGSGSSSVKSGSSSGKTVGSLIDPKLGYTTNRSGYNQVKNATKNNTTTTKKNTTNTTKKSTTSTKKKSTNTTTKKTNQSRVVNLRERKSGETMSEYIARQKALDMR